MGGWVSGWEVDCEGRGVFVGGTARWAGVGGAQGDSRPAAHAVYLASERSTCCDSCHCERME